jgi:hypothetical protein
MSTYTSGYYKTLVGSTWGLEVSWVLLGLPPMPQIEYYRRMYLSFIYGC